MRVFYEVSEWFWGSFFPAYSSWFLSLNSFEQFLLVLVSLIGIIQIHVGEFGVKTNKDYQEFKPKKISLSQCSHIVGDIQKGYYLMKE